MGCGMTKGVFTLSDSVNFILQKSLATTLAIVVLPVP
jgi:hypothetical protein